VLIISLSIEVGNFLTNRSVEERLIINEPGKRPDFDYRVSVIVN